MIDANRAEAAVDFLRDNAQKIAVAKAQVLYLEEWRKVLKARLMRESGETRLGDAESWAYAHAEYAEHLAGYKVAVEEAERLRWLMTAASAQLELYRSQEASRRAERA